MLLSGCREGRGHRRPRVDRSCWLSGLGGPAVLQVVAFAGVALGLNGTLAYAFVQEVTKPLFLGRVMSLLSLVSFGLGPMSFPLYGVGVTAWGARPMFAGCAVIGMLGAAVAVYSLIRGYLPRQPGTENG